MRERAKTYSSLQELTFQIAAHVRLNQQSFDCWAPLLPGAPLCHLYIMYFIHIAMYVATYDLYVEKHFEKVTKRFYSFEDTL